MNLDARKLQITLLGGSGFVGTELVGRLAAKGHRLRVLTRRPQECRTLAVVPTVELVAADVHEPKVLQREFAGSDVVVNLVGILNERGDSGSGFRHAHAELTRKTIEACIAAGVPRLLHMSALGADENGPSHYLRSKGLAEKYVRAAPVALDWTIFRPSVIFGQRDSLLNRFASLLQLGAGFMPLARAQARFAPVWVGDVAHAFELALEGGATSRQSYDLCGPQVMTLGELVRYTGELCGQPARILALPDALGRLQAKIMDFVPGKPFSSDNFRSLTVDNVCAENGFARLGITPARLVDVAPYYVRSESLLDRLRRKRS